MVTAFPFHEFNVTMKIACRTGEGVARASVRHSPQASGSSSCPKKAKRDLLRRLQKEITRSLRIDRVTFPQHYDNSFIAHARIHKLEKDRIPHTIVLSIGCTFNPVVLIP